MAESIVKLGEKVTAPPADKKPAEFKTDLRAAADLLKGKVTIDKDSGTITAPDGAFFEIAIGAGLAVSPESYDATRRAMDLAKNATELVAAEEGVKLMAGNKAVNTVTATMPVHGRDKIEVAINRNGSYRNVQDGTTHAFVGEVGASKFNMVSHRTKAESKQIRDHLKEIALAQGLGS